MMFVSEPATAVSVDRTPLWLLAVPGLCVACLLVFAALQPWITLNQALRDVQLVAFRMDKLSTIPLAGFLSNLGIVAWVVSFAVPGFAALLVSPARIVTLLGAFSAFSLTLGMDDLFLLHERVFPHEFGIPEEMLLLAYTLAGLAIVIGYQREIRDNAGVLLLIAAGCFSVSILVDLLVELDRDGPRVLEDGPKLLGIAYWCAFCCRFSWLAVRREIG